MHEFLPGFEGSAISSDYTDWKGIAPAPNSHRTTEWLRGEVLCTYKGKYHLAWYVSFYCDLINSRGCRVLIGFRFN